MMGCKAYGVAWVVVSMTLLSATSGSSQTVVPGLRPLPPYPVANLNKDVQSPIFFLDEPQEFVRLGGILVFRFQRQLWRTDGTEAGTLPLCDKEPGGCLEVAGFTVPAGGVVFFQARSETGATFQLWRTDGTRDGTFPLTGFSEGGVSSRFFSYQPVTGQFFFPVEGEHGQLWVTDGTVEGTRRVSDVAPTAAFSGRPSHGAALGSILVLGADDADRDDELWRTDGTAEGTFRIADLAPGPQRSAPQNFHVVGNRAVFNAGENIVSFPLWSTDGTADGTFRLPLPRPDPRSVIAAILSSGEGGHLYFQVSVTNEGRELWVTDGTVEGTRVLAPLDLGSGGLAGELLVFENLGSRAVYAARDPEHGRELWTSDGTPEGTLRLTDLCPGSCNFAIRPLQRVGGLLYFVGDDGDGGSEPWVTDGTAAGTRLVGDLCPGPCSSNPLRVVGTDSAGRVFVIANDGLHGNELWLLGDGEPRRVTDLAPTNPFLNRAGESLGDSLVFAGASLADGLSLWRSDGTLEGTRPFVRFLEVSDLGSDPHELTRVGNEVFLITRKLWKTRGTAESTREIPLPDSRTAQSLAPLASPGPPKAIVLASREGTSLLELWKTDGATPSTLLADGVGGRLRAGRHLLPAGDRVFYAARSDSSSEPSELWVTDGTASGTIKLLEPRLGRGNPAVLGDRLFFPAEIDEFDQVELWASDGTPAGTALFADLDGAVSSQPEHLLVAGSTLFFSAGGEGVRRLWKTDGTPQGTVPVLPDGFAHPPRDPVPFGVAGPRVFFFSGRQIDPDALWVSDGTPEGTRRLVSLSLLGTVREEYITSLGDTLFFILPESNRTPRLWSSDGTPGGTGPTSLLPAALEPLSVTTVEDHLVITGRRQSSSSVELWWSDGTPEGTLLVQVFPEPRPAGFVSLGSRVVFSAAAESTGNELWAFDLARVGPPGAAPAAPTNLTAEAIPTGLRNIRLTWRDRSTGETGFEIRARTVLGEPEIVAVAPADTESFTLSAEDPFPYTYEVRAVGPGGASDWSNEASAMELESSGPCVAFEKRLCLLDGRFKVEVYWRDDLNGGADFARAVPFDFSDDSGTFWFFDPANVELVVKVLDARPVNGRFWVFYGALSNVEYWITVTDLQAGRNVTYHNPAGEICGSGDTVAFPRPPLDLAATTHPSQRSHLSPGHGGAATLSGVRAQGPVSLAPLSGAGTAGCTPDETALCLSQSRFRIEVEWTDPRSGNSGAGQAIPGSEDSGFFWFFDPANVELVTKLLDARTVNGNFWFFYGGLSDVEYTITVTDVLTQAQKVYTNAPGNICGQADTQAFPGG